MYNPDENPCHACALVMVYGDDHEQHSSPILMGWAIQWVQEFLTLSSQTYIP